MRPLTILVCLAATSAAASLGAQCPDGTPPPCMVARLARANVIVPSATDRSRHFLVLPFRNVTRQPEQDWLVEGSTTMVSDALSRWQGITVVSDERLYPAIKRAGIAPGSVIEESRVRRVAEETGGWTAITGEVIVTGGRVRVTARAWDVPTNRELVRAASEVPPAGDIRLAFDSVSLHLLRAAGFDNPATDLATATTQDLNAYRAYLRGLANMRRSEIKSAVANFETAVKADSTFALAWAHLAEATLAADPASVLSAANKGGRYAARAAALSSKLPPRRRQIVAAIDATFRAQFGDARTALEGLVAADSNDVDALERLVGLEMFDPLLVPVPGGQRPRGSLNRAARLAKQVSMLDPARHSMFGTLAVLYARAGTPGESPTLGMDRAATSMQDLLQTMRQREHVRVYYSVLRADTFALVPAESLSFMPKDSLQFARRSAREAARAWGERWAFAETGAAAPLQLLSELYAIDGDYPAALAAVAKAESIGVQTPSWSPAARRLLFLGKAGRLGPASRIADSLTTAGFFGNPTNALANPDAAAWGFALHLLNGRLALASTMLDQHTTFTRMVAPNSASPSLSAFQRLMGNSDPEDDPGIPRSFRALQLDTALAHINAFAASPGIGPWLPMLLPKLAEFAGPFAARSSGLLKAAESVAQAGRDTLAFQLASNVVTSDSTLAAAASAFPWYRRGASALHAVQLATQRRFQPGSAVVATDRASFEWKVDDAAPFARSRPETPLGRIEYRWEILVEGDGRYYRLTAAAPPKVAAAQQTTGTLAELLPQSAPRSVLTGATAAGGVQSDTVPLQGAALRTEVAPGVLRMLVTDTGLLEWLRRVRPAYVRFRFLPCAEPLGAPKQCLDERVTINYP